jgi:hypothetical protein
MVFGILLGATAVLTNRNDLDLRNYASEQRVSSRTPTITITRIPTATAVQTSVTNPNGNSSGSGVILPTESKPTASSIPTSTDEFSYRNFKGITKEAVVKGTIRVSYNTPQHQTSSVAFYFDDETQPASVDSVYPYYLGTQGGSNNTQGYDTKKLLNGSHLLRVEVSRKDGTKTVDSLLFFVSN